jgi:ABC-type multidrug transport system ATPase subunit
MAAILCAKAANKMADVKTLSAVGLNKSFKKRHVVNNVSIEFRTGEIVGLLGPNGAGKTTSFYMIVGLIAADSGKVTIDGRDITSLHVYQRSQRHRLSASGSVSVPQPDRARESSSRAPGARHEK